MAVRWYVLRLGLDGFFFEVVQRARSPLRSVRRFLFLHRCTHATITISSNLEAKQRFAGWSA